MAVIVTVQGIDALDKLQDVLREHRYRLVGEVAVLDAQRHNEEVAVQAIPDDRQREAAMRQVNLDDANRRRALTSLVIPSELIHVEVEA